MCNIFDAIKIEITNPILTNIFDWICPKISRIMLRCP